MKPPETPEIPRWWKVAFVVGIVFWGSVLFVALHFIGKYW